LALRDLERYEDAFEFFDRGLELRKKSLGFEHPDVVQSHFNVDAILEKLGQLEETQKQRRSVKKYFGKLFKRG